VLYFCLARTNFYTGSRVPSKSCIFCRNLCCSTYFCDCKTFIDVELELHSSEGVAHATSGENTESATLVEFTDETPGEVVDVPSLEDPSFFTSYIDETALTKFLNRPLRLVDTTWVAGSTLTNLQFQPWHLFFNSTNVKYKMHNYAFINCKLHLKVVVNASPFFYGAAMLSYLPNTAISSTTINPLLPNNNDCRYSPLSTRQKIMIYPQTSQGGELILPFFYHKNWLAVKSATDFQEMGVCTLQSLTPLQEASTSTGTGVSIAVYGWATDVKLTGSTSALALQMNEYVKGPVSNVASAVSGVAKKASAIPMLAPYAKATDMVASAVGSVASLFGFTNVPIIEDAKPLRPSAFYNFASPEISQPTEKLTMDPKNELSIDPRVAGLGEHDEMLISNFVNRDCYVTQFNWNMTNITDDCLFTTFPSPHYVNTAAASQAGTTQNMVAGTPTSHVAALFNSWRGDITFRFRFICSKFHRGRVIIQWDPVNDISLQPNDSNVAFSKIIDISEETDVEIRVPYLQAREWLDTPLYIGKMYNSKYFGAGNSTTVPTAFDNRCNNGYLAVKCLTNLTSPIATANIQVLVSVRSDNLCFANPRPPPQDYYMFDLQSSDYEIHSGENQVSYEQPRELVMGTASEESPNSALVYMGERIVSLRQILRRTCYSWTRHSLANSADLITIIRTPHAVFPLYPGYDGNGKDIAIAQGSTDEKSYNWVNTTPTNWFAPCFKAYRGSHVWHYNVQSDCPLHYVKAARSSSGIPQSNDLPQGRNYYSQNNISVSRSRYQAGSLSIAYMSNGFAGMSYTNPKTQAGISAHYPMYSSYRFRSVDPDAITLGTTVDDTNLESGSIEFTLRPSSAPNNGVQGTTVDFFHAVGTDFTLLCFTNIPTLVLYSTVTPGPTNRP
jgi:hypothetical protein